jgi:hypothetical protein
VYENEAWFARAALVPPDAKNVAVDTDDPIAAGLRSDPRGVEGVDVSESDSATAGPGTLLWSEAANDSWHASADGSDPARRDAFGWTNAFDLSQRESVDLTFDGGLLKTLAMVFVIVAWIIAVVAWRRTRPVIADTISGTTDGAPR